LRLAVPIETTAAQWQQIAAAIKDSQAAGRNVRVIVSPVY
jgi:hypothetical protein